VLNFFILKANMMNSQMDENRDFEEEEVFSGFEPRDMIRLNYSSYSVKYDPLSRCQCSDGHYAQLLAEAVMCVKEWKDEPRRENEAEYKWFVGAEVATGIVIQCCKKVDEAGIKFQPIWLPPRLGASLYIGWDHSSESYDPKFIIAERLINIFIQYECAVGQYVFMHTMT
jgi:hypothetical protein